MKIEVQNAASSGCILYCKALEFKLASSSGNFVSKVLLLVFWVFLEVVSFW